MVFSMLRAEGPSAINPTDNVDRKAHYVELEIFLIQNILLRNQEILISLIFI